MLTYFIFEWTCNETRGQEHRCCAPKQAKKAPQADHAFFTAPYNGKNPGSTKNLEPFLFSDIIFTVSCERSQARCIVRKHHTAGTDLSLFIPTTSAIIQVLQSFGFEIIDNSQPYGPMLTTELETIMIHLFSIGPKKRRIALRHSSSR